MRVFISYKHVEDETKFDDVRGALENADIKLWKKDEIAPGKALGEGLRNAIESCAVCVFIATQKSVESSWCQAEIGAFWGVRKPVVVYVADDKLKSEDLPKQFQSDKRATTHLEVVNAVKLHLSEAAEATLISQRPANLFWLGHDLARAIRLAKFEPDYRDELDAQLIQSLHHLHEIGLPAPDARKLLLDALKRHRSGTALSEEEREKFVTAIRNAKNEIGNGIEHLQPGFIGYANTEAKRRFNQEVDGLPTPNQ